MSCEWRTAVDAYVDGELSAREAAAFEAHLASCAPCADARASREALVEVVRHAPVFTPPRRLEARLHAALGAAGPRVRWARLGPMAVALAAGLAAGLTLRPALGPRGVGLAEEITAAHVRSLLADHLTDVQSSDRHTVKPWFQGKVGYGLPIAEWSAEGFTLLGGRLDLVEGRPVAALVYGLRDHRVNVFVWPAEADAPVERREVRGYTSYDFAARGMRYWIISDVDDPGLAPLVHALRGSP